MSNWTKKMREDWNNRAKADLLHFVYWKANRSLDAFFEEGRQQSLSLLSPMLERLEFSPGGKRILEIGCGIGRLFPGFQEVGFSEIWGVDLSQEMIERGRELCPVRQARFMLGNGQDLGQIASDYFDYCFSYNVFGYVPDKRVLWQYLVEAHRVLKPSGVLQMHYRARHTPRTRAMLILPTGLRELARYCYYVGNFRWLTGRPMRSNLQRYGPGDFKTYMGVAVSPRTVAQKLDALGFVDVQTFPDSSYKDANAWFWAVARKP